MEEIKSWLLDRPIEKIISLFGFVLCVLFGPLDPFLSYASFRFDPDKDPLHRQSFDTSDLAYKKRLAFHYTFESFYEQARGDVQRAHSFRDKVRDLQTFHVSEDILLERAKEEINQTVGHAYEATHLLARVPPSVWTKSFETEVREKFFQAEKGFSDLFGSHLLPLSALKKGNLSPLSSLRKALAPSELSSTALPFSLLSGVRFEEEATASLSPGDFDAFVKIQGQGSQRYLCDLYDQGQKHASSLYDFESTPDPVKITFSGSDLKATFLLEDSGTLILTGFQREEGSLPPSFGLQTEGTFVNKASILVEALGVQAKAVHNFSLIKCVRGHFLLSYFFNGGVLHTGNSQDQLNLFFYKDYLVSCKRVQNSHSPSAPSFQQGLLEDQGVALHEATVEVQNLTYEAKGVGEFQNLFLHTAPLKNNGILHVKGTLYGREATLENHHTALISSLPMPLKFLSNSGSGVLFLKNVASLEVVDLDNQGVIYGTSTHHLRSKKNPKQVGIFLTETDLEIQIDELLEEIGLGHLRKNTCPFSRRHCVKFNILTHIDHYLNTITTYYELDLRTGLRRVVDRTETGYVFQRRETQRTQKIEEGGTERGDAFLDQYAQSKTRAVAVLGKLQKGLRALLSKYQKAGLSKGAMVRALRKKLQQAGLSGEEISALLEDPFTQSFLNQIEAKTSSPLLKVLDGGAAFQKWVQTQKAAYPNFTRVAGTFLKTMGHTFRGMSYLQGCTMGAAALSETIVGAPVGCLGGMALVAGSEHLFGTLLDQGQERAGDLLAAQASTPQKAADYRALGKSVVQTATLVTGVKGSGKSLKGKKEHKVSSERGHASLPSTQLTQLRQRVIQTRFASPEDARALGFKGERVEGKIKGNLESGFLRINTESTGGFKEAKKIFRDLKKEMTLKCGKCTSNNEKGKGATRRLELSFENGSLLQLRPKETSGYTKIEIKDTINNTYEKITFNPGGTHD